STPPPTASSTLSLHDALPISVRWAQAFGVRPRARRGSARAVPTIEVDLVGSDIRGAAERPGHRTVSRASVGEEETMNERTVIKKDRKSTRLNSSHLGISYAVF